MAKNDTKGQQAEGVEALDAALTRTERYLEKNRKWLVIGLLAIVLIITGYLGYRHFYMAPLEEEAQRQAFFAQQQFEKDAYALALNGDGNNLGFLALIDEYGRTKIGNLSRYYAGICYRELGNFDSAILLLERYKIVDEMVAPIALGALGDCYVEKGDLDRGLTYYNKASDYKENTLTAPIFLMKKAGILEGKGDWKGAIAAYETIKTQYPRSNQARLIDKYIERARVLEQVPPAK